MSLRPHVLVLTYGLRQSDPGAYEELAEALAPAFAAVPGLASTVWLASNDRKRFGGFYLFESRASFDAFISGELFGAVWSHPALLDRRAEEFEVASGPTVVIGGVLVDTATSLAKGGA